MVTAFITALSHLLKNRSLLWAARRPSPAPGVVVRCSGIEPGPSASQVNLHFFLSFAGLLAARFMELGRANGPVTHQVSTLLEGLESTLLVWRTHQENEAIAARLDARLTILNEDYQETSGSLASLQTRINTRDAAQSQLSTYEEERLRGVAVDVEAELSEKQNLLTHWLNPSTGIFCLPESGSEDCSQLVKAITDYRAIARAYLLPANSRFHLHHDNPEWFASRRQAAIALRECLDADTISSSSLECLFRNKIASRPINRVDREVVGRLETALAEAKSLHKSLQDTNYLSHARNETLSTLLAEGEASIYAFIAKQQNPMALLPAFKWALMKHLYVWINAMFLEHSELTTRIDFLHQHTGVIASVFALLDGSRHHALPFWAGPEADAQSELQFFFTVHHFVSQVLELRDTLVSHLPQLEDALLEAGSGGWLLDSVGRLIIDGKDIDVVQFSIGKLLDQDSGPGSRLSQVLLTIHSVLVNATSSLEALSRRMADFPITDLNWVYVDVVAQAIGPLQSRCTASMGATNLWGWNPGLPNEPTTTWADEVYLSGMRVVLRIAEELQHASAEFNPSATTSSSMVLESEFLNPLTDRLALVCQAALAASRLLCALLEESGMPVRQAVFDVRQQRSVCVERMVQSADFYAAQMQPPEVQTLCSITGSMMESLYSRTYSHVQKVLSSRAVEEAAGLVESISRLRLIYAWLHGEHFVGADGTDSSLRACLSRIQSALACWEVDKEATLYQLGEAICAAEFDRLQYVVLLRKMFYTPPPRCYVKKIVAFFPSQRISTYVEDEMIPLLVVRDALWEEFNGCNQQLTPLDLDLLKMKVHSFSGIFYGPFSIRHV